MPGITLFIKDKSSVWYGSAGKADIANNTAMQTCQLSKVASPTKLFMTVSTFKLAE
jgi:hypothetical protein